jgi:Zn-dependent protease with chaperone function
VRKAALTAVFVLACTLAADASSDPTEQALRFFEGLAGRDPDAILRLLRPPLLRAEQRARVLAALPDFSDLQRDLDERAKLAMLETVLVYHERAHAFEIKVIDSPQAAVVLYQRAVLLISRTALRLISAGELQTLVAHEIGHEYFWREFEDTPMGR